MTILVIGATGFIGRPLVSSLRSRGREVIALSRHPNVTGDACDRTDIAALSRIAKRRNVQIVIDLIAYTEGDTLPLIEALAGHVEKYLLVSSLDVYRNYEGLHRKREPTLIVDPLDEDSPVREGRYPYRKSSPRPNGSPDAWLDDYDKIPLEQALRRSGQPHAILRLPMVYGPGDRQQRFAWTISPMLKGKDRLVVDPGWAAWRTTYGFVDDVADAIAVAACSGGALKGTFNLGEADPPDHQTWISRFADALGWAGNVVWRDAPPQSAIDQLNLKYTLVADTRRFRAATGWSEPTPPQERYVRTIAEQERQDAVAIP